MKAGGVKMADKIKVLIVEDDDLITKHYRTLLSKDPDLDIAGGAANGYEAVMLAALQKPDVILLDVELEDKQAGLRAASEILAHMPEIKIVVLTVCETDETVFRAFELGVTDYLLKNMPPEDVIKAVKDAFYDRSPIHANIASKIKREFRRIKSSEDNLFQYFSIITQLTPAELENLELLLNGYSRDEICSKRHIEFSTLKTQIYSTMKKFNKDNISEVLEILRDLHLLEILSYRKRAGL